MLVREMQLANAAYPMFVTLSGNVMFESEVQFENAESPILATLLPIVTLVSEAQI